LLSWGGICPGYGCHEAVHPAVFRCLGNGTSGPSEGRAAAPWWCRCPRGWSRVHADAERDPALLPAPAGMVPRSGTCRGPRRTAPSPCGGWPLRRVGPGQRDLCSPPVWGWPLRDASLPARGLLLPAPARELVWGRDLAVAFIFPARAGVVPTPRPSSAPRRAVPRLRGDGPGIDADGRRVHRCPLRPRDGPDRNHPSLKLTLCSPPAWGWPLHLRRRRLR
jgi:hypothetical protein